MRCQIYACKRHRLKSDQIQNSQEWIGADCLSDAWLTKFERLMNQNTRTLTINKNNVNAYIAEYLLKDQDTGWINMEKLQSDEYSFFKVVL